MLKNTSKNEISTILFDLDGTIIDSERTAAEALSRCFQGWGIQLDAQDAQFLVGRKFDIAIRYLSEKYSFPYSLEETQEKIISAYRRELEREFKSIPGVVKSIESLAEVYPLALVSGSHRAEIFFALKKLNIERHFKFILGAEDYPNSKPEPDGYLKALGLLGELPQSALIFEDSEPGIQSGLDAGAWVVAVTAANHYGQNTQRAHFEISNFHQVTPEWVRALRLTKK